MNRTIRPLLATLAIGGIALAPATFAADYSLAGGAVKFSAPDTWPVLMEKTEGSSQFIALQVHSPADANALARITVKTDQVAGIQGFQAFVNDNTERARKLPGYTPVNDADDPSRLRYTAVENHEKNIYTEHYFYRSNLAIQVRCVRPAEAPSDWRGTFDADCHVIVAAAGK